MTDKCDDMVCTAAKNETEDKIETEKMDHIYSNIFIALSGLISSGKTTIAKALAKELGLKIFHEPVQSNIYLRDFYKDIKNNVKPSKNASFMQIYLLLKRYNQQQQINWSEGGAVSDRSIYEDEVFCRMLVKGGFMDERDHQTYKDLFTSMSNVMKHPDVIIHLDVSPEESYRRIEERMKNEDRDFEMSITLEYLQALDAEYQEFLKEISRKIKVIRVPWEEFRPTDEVIKVLTEELNRESEIRSVTF